MATIGQRTHMRSSNLKKVNIRIIEVSNKIEKYILGCRYIKNPLKEERRTGILSI